jgi:hypothetical protein
MTTTVIIKTIGATQIGNKPNNVDKHRPNIPKNVVRPYAIGELESSFAIINNGIKKNIHVTIAPINHFIQSAKFLVTDASEVSSATLKVQLSK